MVDTFAPAGLLAQMTTAATSGPTLAYSAVHHSEIKRMVVVNTNLSATAGQCTIYHADNGEGFSAGNALRFGHSIAAKTHFEIVANDDGSGISVKAGGKIGVNATTSSMTLSIYGTTRAGR